MTTHPFTISGAQNAVSAREDIEDALQALASNNSADNEPSTPYANMWWYETDTQLLKIRDEDNLSWINVAYINQSTDKFEVLDDTKVVTTSGTQVGILGDQATATWETGTGTTESLVSPFKIASAIDALAFQDVSLSAEGKVKLGFGLEVVWGYFTSANDETETQNFHTAFTNNCWGMAMGGTKNPGTEGFSGNSYCAVRPISKTQFQSNRPDAVQGTTAQFYYIAWGN